jgi:two-component system sensor histidine kinase AlgZ
VAVTQVAVFMIGLGRWQSLDVNWLAKISAFGQSLALLCALGICVTRAWLTRMTPRGAWLGGWLIALVLAICWSYGVGVVTTVLGSGPGQAGLFGFILQSVLAVALVSAALMRYLFIREQWLAEVTAQSEARVQALQARIRPHFLFNSLNTIASLIPDEPQLAERATLDLADLFRGSMRRADRMIPLADELELARKYMAMEQCRLGDRLEIEWRVEELPGAAQVLPMILQPLLENAIAHGIQKSTEGGKVQAYGRRELEHIVITVSNPVGDARATPLRHQASHGMALRNIRARLNLAYGERASLITHVDTQQFIAVLTLPYVESTDR